MHACVTRARVIPNLSCLSSSPPSSPTRARVRGGGGGSGDGDGTRARVARRLGFATARVIARIIVRVFPNPRFPLVPPVVPCDGACGMSRG